MQETKYNGWTNYNTWAAALWIDNEEYTYKYFRGIAAEIREEETEKSEQIYRLENAIKDFIEENAPELPASVYSDLLGFSIGQINFYEIAEYMLDE